jgi:hypothetical protein
VKSAPRRQAAVKKISSLAKTAKWNAGELGGMVFGGVIVKA